MKIDHIAIMTRNLNEMIRFYVQHFGCTTSEIYSNPIKKLTTCFLSFGDGTRIELMHIEDMAYNNRQSTGGLIHLAIKIGSKEKVDDFTRKLKSVGVTIISEPRFTGDGYYESVISDPEGNLIELTA
ncbi:VOC family protein [Saccharicrinis sp. FJH62]|uniref:VOC family protein n=1 Tax=Saccharicrinis sp. FJH62 TaxID=3344657 RepID=UPI0035D524A9